METCPECDSAIEETDQYCRHCGAALHTESEKQGTYPPEASPMFGGETWNWSRKTNDSSAADEQSGGNSTTRSNRGTYPPEASPMFGGETWDWSRNTNDPSAAEQSPNSSTASSSPMADEESSDRHANAARNTLIYALAALAVIVTWYFVL